MPAIPGVAVTNITVSYMRRVQIAEYQPAEAVVSWTANVADGVDPSLVTGQMLAAVRNDVLSVLTAKGAMISATVAEAATVKTSAEGMPGTTTTTAAEPPKETAAQKKAREKAEAAALAAAQKPAETSGMPGTTTAQTSGGMPGTEQQISTGNDRTEGMPGTGDAADELEAMLAGAVVTVVTKAQVVAQITQFVQKAKVTPAQVNGVIASNGFATLKAIPENDPALGTILAEITKLAGG